MAFARWQQQDLNDWAKQANESIDTHEHFPLPPARALRAAIYADQQGCAEAFVQQVMRAYWQQQLDISNLDTLAEIGVSLGLEHEKMVTVPDDEAYALLLEENNQQALDAGVFDVPTVEIAGKLYVGHDRLDFAL